MKTKRFILTYIAVMLLLLLLGSVLIALSFRTALFSFLDVFFYRGIALILFWGLVITGAFLLMRSLFFKDVFLYRDAVLLFVVFCSVNLLFFTHVPVTAERSISVFMLGTMSDHSEQTFSEEEMEDFFVERYVKDFGAFEKRFHEQVATGTIEEVAPGEYRITESGKKLMKMYETVADWYRIDDRLIHPDKESNG